MNGTKTISLDGMHAIEVQQNKEGVQISFRVGGVTMMRRQLTRAQARDIGDALGFASNDVEAGHAAL